MTECPKCKGYGIVGSAVPDILRGRGAIFSSNECDMCHGSGEVPLTNEEWLRSLNTEQLAEFLADQCNDVVDFILRETDEQAGNIEPDDYWYRQDVIVEWLKQPHTPKE